MSELRSTAKHALVYSFANVVGRIVGFVMLPLYSHALGGAGYGVIGMIDASLNFLVSLMGYGFNEAIIRHYHDQDLPNRQASITTGMTLVATFNVLTLTPVALLAKPLSQALLGDSSLYPYLLMAIGTFFFETVGSTASTHLLVQRRSMLFSFIGLIRLVVGLFLNIWLIVILDWGVKGYFLSGLVVNVLAFTIYVGVVFKDRGYQYDRTVARAMIRFQLPLVPGYLFTFLSRQVERIIVRYEINLAAVGVLEFGYKIPALLGMIVTRPFMNAWHTKRTEIAHQPGAPIEFGRALSLYFFLACYLGTAISITVGDLIQILTPAEFLMASRIAQIEVATMLVIGLHRHLYFGLFYEKRTGTLSKIRIGQAIIKVILSYFFIRNWGIMGASFSSLISNAMALIVVTLLSQRLFRIQIQTTRMLFIALLALVVFFLAGSGWLEGSLLASASWTLFNLILRGLEGLGLILQWGFYTKLMGLVKAESTGISNIISNLFLLQMLWLACPVNLFQFIRRRRSAEVEEAGRS